MRNPKKQTDLQVALHEDFGGPGGWQGSKVNVKLVLAEIVQKHMAEKGPLSGEEEFVQLRNKLANDANE